MAITNASLYILLALARESRHGLGIADDIESFTQGRVSLGPGTLYRSLKAMTNEGLITAAEEGSDDPRRKYYRISDEGRRVLQSEASVLASVVDVAEGRGVLG